MVEFKAYLLSWKPAVTIYLVVCLRVDPTRVRTKKVQKGTASACRKTRARFTQNERVCHTICGLKCGIWRTPPHVFSKPKKHVGGVYFTWSGEIFLRNFLPYPPPNIPGLKGGDIHTLYVTYIIYISRICTLKLLLICTTSLLYTCSTQVCLAWLVLVH